MKAVNIDGSYLTYKGKPLVRKGNDLFYGDLSDDYYLSMMIMSQKTVKVGETSVEVPDTISADELDRLIRAKKPSLKPTKVIIHTKGIVARESTRPVSSAAALARRAADFIQANSTSGIKVVDVVKHLGCSRRIAELRFKEAKRQTISDFITACRLAMVKDRLAASSATVSEIAAECGFKTAAHLSHLFKRRFGQSIGDWRKTLRGPAPAIGSIP